MLLGNQDQKFDIQSAMLWHPVQYIVRFGVWMRQLIIYCFGRIVDLVVLLVYYSGCVDRSGSLSGGAFNQLRLATLKIVLTILY